MSAALERRYARLLLLYPGGYRSELLGTLMESTDDGRRWPPLREVGPLIVGALRIRAGRDRRQSVRQTLLAAMHTAVLMLLISDVAGSAVAIAVNLRFSVSMWTPPEQALTYAALVVGLVAVVAAWHRRYLVAITTATVAFAASAVVAWSMQFPVFSGYWWFPLAILLLLPLLRHRPQPATGLLRYLPVAPLLVILIDQASAQMFPAVSGIIWRAAVLAGCLGALLWLAVDERVAMALGLLLINVALVQTVMAAQGGQLVLALTSIAISGALPAVLLLASGSVARRRAKI